MKYLYIGLLVQMAFSFVCCKNAPVKPYITGMENKPLPSFTILLSDSVTYFNTSNLERDKRLILFYYSPGCPYCRTQMREILNHMDEYKNNQFLIVTDGAFKEMRQFISYFQLDKYSNVVVGQDTGSVVFNRFNVLGVPFTAVFNQDNLLESAFLGRLKGISLSNITGAK